MRKKLKITEEQLKRLVSTKDNISENMDTMSHEGQMNEIGVGSIEMGLAKEVAPYLIEKLKELGIEDISGMSVEIFTKALRHEISNYKDDSNMESEMPVPPSEEETMNNQVYESIKNNFKRFL